MTDLLANPIWHSLSTRHSDLAQQGNHLAKRYRSRGLHPLLPRESPSRHRHLLAVLPHSSPTRPRRPRRSPSLRLHPWLFKAETLQPNSREWKEIADLQNAALSRQWPEHLCSRWFGPLSRSHGRHALGRPFKRVLKESPSERRRSRKGHHYAVSVKTEHAVRRYDLDAY